VVVNCETQQEALRHCKLLYKVNLLSSTTIVFHTRVLEQVSCQCVSSVLLLRRSNHVMYINVFVVGSFLWRLCLLLKIPCRLLQVEVAFLIRPAGAKTSADECRPRAALEQQDRENDTETEAKGRLDEEVGETAVPLAEESVSFMVRCGRSQFLPSHSGALRSQAGKWRCAGQERRYRPYCVSFTGQCVRERSGNEYGHAYIVV
jgi:hypothetical protein